MKSKMQQAPIRNANTIGAFIYSHSGEFAPVCTDLHLTGRGLDFKFIRAYRSSLADHIGELGRGWSSNIAKKIERNGDDIICHDGAGEVYKFTGENENSYTSPAGFYGTLVNEEKQFLIHQRYGFKYRFEDPEQGGRIVSIEDSNQNSIQFSYAADKIVIIDTLKRKIVISVNNGLLQQLKDHAGRTWKYTYDNDDRLIEVTQPATADFPNGTSVNYAYDADHRLISITDAKGQKYLVNGYDKSGKVVRQEHGSGMFTMKYDPISQGENGESIYRTTCIRKNGSKLLLEHNEVGNVLSRTLYVRKESFASEDKTGIKGKVVPLTTKSAYNKNSELTSRTFPAGNKIEWVYSEDEKDIRNQGNLLQIMETPQTGVESDQTSIVTNYEYEAKFQLTTAFIDPRGSKTSYEYDEQGNLIVTTYPSVTIQPVNGDTPRPSPVDRIQTDEYRYNSMGQVLRRKHIDNSITEYHYYPIENPIGTHGLNTATNNPDRLCGYLARVVRDANGKKVKIEYAYDDFGNATTVFDGKSNPARLRYNAMGKVESVTSREPFKNRIDYKYDANYNEIESTQLFERLEYDATNQTTNVTSSTLRELTEYNALDNATQRKIVGDDKIITEYFLRDADERIIRLLQPLGNATEYVYDERNLLIEKKFGVGTRETCSNRFTYTLNSAVRTYTDGNGKKTTHHYDGFHRYKGFTNPVGTKKTQWFDEADNVVRVEIDGDNGLPTKKSRVRQRGSTPLMEATYHFDQWNRVYRVDKAWHNYSNGHKLGESKWNGEKGIVSTVLEYAENGLPGKVWTETDNVVDVEYDGVGRVIKTKDLTGDEFSFEYDENNNPTLMKHLGPETEGTQLEQVIRRRYDEMDRLIWQQENDEAPERFAYNALGNVINYVGKSGIEIHYTDDSLGRRVGHAFTISDELDSTTAQEIVRQFEYDDNYRLSAYTDAAGKRTLYRYDALDRQIGVVFPDGNAADVEYDANGNVVREVDQNKTEISNRYDASNRLIERRSHIKQSDATTVERYEYDGLSRLVAAIAPDATIRRTYDSLSRLLTEQQGDHMLKSAHDAAGNVTRLVYPGGDEVQKAYDIRNRVTSVKNKAGETIASFVYRTNDQIARMLLGNVIETDYSYNQQERLESIEYRRTDNQQLIDGFQYQYDDTGKITHEIQLREGSTFGERYYYDVANRAIRAQYGVQDVFDPTSPFEQETSYEHFPEGGWKRRVDSDGQGQITDEQIGTVDKLNNYKHFGKLDFEYDVNGNCIRKSKSNPGYCDYAFDEKNRLIKSECYDAQGDKTQTIEYFYDALGRQVRKVVTDQSGNVIDYTYVWAGHIILEEYENGVLARTYLYGNDSMPFQLSANNGVRSYYYTHNGRELVSGLLYQFDPYAFAERYGYELTGDHFMTEINGIAMAIPLRHTAISDLENSILFPNYLRDKQNGTASFWGIHIDPGIHASLNHNGYGGGGNGIGSLLAHFKQHFGVDMSSLVSPVKGPISTPNKGGLPPGVQTSSRAPNWSLYAMDGGTVVYRNGGTGGGPFNFSSQLPDVKAPPSGLEKLGQKIMDSPVGKVVTKAIEAGVPIVGPAGSNPATQDKPVSDPSPKGQPGNGPPDQPKPAEPAPAPTPAPAPKPDPTKLPMHDDDDMYDLDSGPVPPTFLSLLQSVPPSPQQVEAKFMNNKTPVNPNGGYVSPGIDTSSPPRSRTGSDPLIEYWDGESSGSEDGRISILYITGGGVTRHVEGWVPLAPEAKPGGGGISPNTGQPMP